jgi:hypothetical protein
MQYRSLKYLRKLSGSNQLSDPESDSLETVWVWFRLLLNESDSLANDSDSFLFEQAWPHQKPASLRMPTPSYKTQTL